MSIAPQLQGWNSAAGVAGVVALAYFIGLRLEPELFAEEGISLFRPASGIGAGIMIAARASARVPVAAGILLATAGAGFLGGHSLGPTLFGGLCNTGEAAIAAYLIGRWFGAGLEPASIPRIMGFLAAAGLAAAAAAVAWTVAASVDGSGVPLLQVWWQSFLANWLGIATIAPLLIEARRLLALPPPRGILVEGTAALALLIGASAYVLALSDDTWLRLVPVILLLPMMLWITARYPPVFGVTGLVIVVVVILCSATFGLGRFGESAVPLADRALAAQTTALTLTVSMLVLNGLFAERRDREARLESSRQHLTDRNERLRLALDGASLGAFAVEFATQRFEADARAAFIHGHLRVPETLKEGRCYIQREDKQRIDAHYMRAQQAPGPWSTEYRVVPPPGHPLAGQVRWVGLEGTFVRDGQGKPLRLLAVTRDLTEQRRMEDSIRRHAAWERRVLREISSGIPLATVLDDLARTAEQWSEQGMMASILFLDSERKRVLHGAAPSLPKVYNDAIHGAEIGPKAGSCGTAAYRGEAVIVSDIATDPLWEDYRHLALPHGLRACWSIPIKASDGRVLGTFANYYREPRTPTPQDLDTVHLMAHTAALALERHAFDQVLRESRERLQLALDGAELGVWRVDLKTGRFETDQRCTIIHGFDPQVPPKTAREARAFVHPADLSTVDAAFEAAQKSGRPCRAEYRVRRPGEASPRTARWIALQGTIVRGSDGKATQILGVTRDITESKLVEENLRKQEEALRRLLGALPAAIFTTDAAGCITYYNRNASELWGAVPELGKCKWGDLARLYHPDGRPMGPEDCPVEIVLSGEAVPDREAILERPDGSRVPIRTSPRPLFDDEGAVAGVVNLVLDIAERKQAEAALSERNAQLALAGKSVRVGSYTFDIETQVMQVSAGYAAIYGLPEGTTEIMRSLWRSRVYPEDLARLDAERRRCFADKRDEHISEYRILHPSGETRWIESRSRITYGREGAAARMVGVNIDVTDRKQAEDHKNLLIAELDHRVKNALATVAAIAQHTQASCSSVEEFVRVFEGRVRSMANAHALLSRGRWKGVHLAELVRGELAPCMESGNTVIEGEDIVLGSEAAQAVVMVLHELATNASKYGALSSSQGRVRVRWDRTRNGGTRAGLVLDWQEEGGPAVTAPSKTGYGTRLIRDLIPYELGGSVDLVFAREGIRCSLKVPGEWIGEAGEDAVSALWAGQARFAER